MDKLEIVQELMKDFRMERIVYVILTVISAITLLMLGLYLIISKQDYSSFAVLMAPTGTLTLCIFRILKMWDDALKFINTQKDNETK